MKHELSKEQLIKRIEKQIDITATIIERLGDDSSSVSMLAVEAATMDMAIFDIALAALAAHEQEPVAWLNDAYLARGVVDGEAGSEDNGPGYIPVYREPHPAPSIPALLPPEIARDETDGWWMYQGRRVGGGAAEWYNKAIADVKALGCQSIPAAVPEEMTKSLASIAKEYQTSPQNALFIVVGWNACRAAMLQSEPQSAPQNIPVNIPAGYVLVPIEPTETMVINGFESEPDEFFSETDVWEAYQEMSGCEQAAHRATLCWAAMIASAPKGV